MTTKTKAADRRGDAGSRRRASAPPAPPCLAVTGHAWTVHRTHTHAHSHKYPNNSFCFKGVWCHYVLHNNIRLACSGTL